MVTSIYTKGFHVLQATSCRLQATGGRLQATGNRRGASGPLGVSGYKPGATGYKLQVASYRLQASCVGSALGSFPYDGGLSESGDFQLHMLHRCCALK